jgi:hypothetical protein
MFINSLRFLAGIGKVRGDTRKAAFVRHQVEGHGLDPGAEVENMVFEHERT